MSNVNPVSLVREVRQQVTAVWNRLQELEKLLSSQALPTIVMPSGAGQPRPVVTTKSQKPTKANGKAFKRNVTVDKRPRSGDRFEWDGNMYHVRSVDDDMLTASLVENGVPKIGRPLEFGIILLNAPEAKTETVTTETAEVVEETTETTETSETTETTETAEETSEVEDFEDTETSETDTEDFEDTETPEVETEDFEDTEEDADEDADFLPTEEEREERYARLSWGADLEDLDESDLAAEADVDIDETYEDD